MLPIDRTNLTAAQTNQVPNALIRSALNIAAIQTPYDTIDELYNYTSGLVAGGVISPYPPLNFNKLINGNFDVWQRGNSFTNPTSGSYTADRFVTAYNTDGGTLPVLVHSRLSLNPGDIPAATYGYNLNSNGTGAALGVNSSYDFHQRIENGTRLLCGLGKKITISFWAKSDIVGKKLGCFASQLYGTGGTPSATEILVGKIFTLTSTWAKYTLTLSANTLSGKTFGTNNDAYLQLTFSHSWGATTGNIRFGAAGNLQEGFGGVGNISIAQVQLNSVDTALPFQPKSYAQEEFECMRFYEPLDFNALLTLVRSGAASIYAKYPFKVKKRVTPTLANASDLSPALGSGSKQIAFNRISDNIAITAIGNVIVAADGSIYMTPNIGSVTFSAATSFSGTAGDAIYIAQTTKDTLIGFDAEL